MILMPNFTENKILWRNYSTSSSSKGHFFLFPPAVILPSMVLHMSWLCSTERSTSLAACHPSTVCTGASSSLDAMAISSHVHLGSHLPPHSNSCQCVSMSFHALSQFIFTGSQNNSFWGYYILMFSNSVFSLEPLFSLTYHRYLPVFLLSSLVFFFFA